MVCFLRCTQSVFVDKEQVKSVEYSIDMHNRDDNKTRDHKGVQDGPFKSA